MPTTLLKARKPALYSQGKERTDDKGRKWTFSEETRRWKLTDGPKAKKSKSKSEPKSSPKPDGDRPTEAKPTEESMMDKITHALVHEGDLLSENVVAWKTGKILGGAIAQFAIAHGAHPGAVEIISETVVQASTATLLNAVKLYRKNGDVAPRDVAAYFIRQVSAAYLGKYAHQGTELAMEQLGIEGMAEHLAPLFAGKGVGLGTVATMARYHLDSRVVDAVIDRSKSDINILKDFVGKIAGSPKLAPARAIASRFSKSANDLDSQLQSLLWDLTQAGIALALQEKKKTMQKSLYHYNGVLYTLEQDGDRLLLKAAKKRPLKNDGKPYTDDKGRKWEFNESTRRWKLADGPKKSKKDKKKSDRPQESTEASKPPKPTDLKELFDKEVGDLKDYLESAIESFKSSARGKNDGGDSDTKEDDNEDLSELTLDDLFQKAEEIAEDVRSEIDRALIRIRRYSSEIDIKESPKDHRARQKLDQYKNSMNNRVPFNPQKKQQFPPEWDMFKSIFTFDGHPYTLEQDGDRLLLKAARKLKNDGKPYTDDKGRKWEFNESTRRWKLADGPKKKSKKDAKADVKGKATTKTDEKRSPSKTAASIKSIQRDLIDGKLTPDEALSMADEMDQRKPGGKSGKARQQIDETLRTYKPPAKQQKSDRPQQSKSKESVENTKKISSQPDFDSAVESTFNKLDDGNNLVPILGIREALGDRISSEDFDTYIKDLGTRGYTLIGGEATPTSQYSSRQLIEGGIRTALGGNRFYIQRS